MRITGEKLITQADDAYSDLKSLIRKLKIKSVFNKTELNYLKHNLRRINKHEIKIAKYISRYGCITGSYMYSVLGLLNKSQFKDFDLIVNQENLDMIKESYTIKSHDFYSEIDINSVGFFRYKGTMIDVFLMENIDYVTVDGVKFQKNLLNTLSEKLIILEEKIKSSHPHLLYIKGDVNDIVSVLSKKIKPFEIFKTSKFDYFLSRLF